MFSNTKLKYKDSRIFPNNISNVKSSEIVGISLEII
jgi:hypothetical protein